MTAILVSAHAIQRCIERGGARTEDEARALLTSRAIACAATFGAQVVRIGGLRIILKLTASGAIVITVLNVVEGRWPPQLRPTFMDGAPPVSSIPGIKDAPR